MCTTIESKLFQEAINNLMGIEEEKASYLALSFLTQEAKELDGKELDFPVKDRSVSRKHNTSRRRAKEKSCNSKATAFKRDHDLYNAGLDSKGTTFKSRSLNKFADLDELEYIKGNEHCPITLNEDDYSSYEEWKEESLYENSYFSICFTMESLQREIESLASKGVQFDAETVREAEFLINKREELNKRKSQIYSERPIIAWEIHCYDYYDSGADWAYGIYPTKELAEEVLRLIPNEDDVCYEILPVQMFTEEQVRELKALGFQPVIVM